MEREAESSESESDLDEDAPSPTTAAENKKRLQERRAGGPKEGWDASVGSVDSIAKNAMLNEKKVSEEDYAGRGPGGRTDNIEDGGGEAEREQEIENFVQEELYIHGKVSSTQFALTGFLLIQLHSF